MAFLQLGGGMLRGDWRSKLLRNVGIDTEKMWLDATSRRGDLPPCRDASEQRSFGWAPVTAPTFDAKLDVMHRGFAAYKPVPSAPFEAVTSATAPAEALYLLRS